MQVALLKILILMKHTTSILCIFIAIIFINCKKQEQMKPATLFVGTYTNTDSEGIYSYQFDSNTGMLTEEKLEATLPSPSFVKISPDKKFLYAVQETNTYDNISGGVSAFAISEVGLKSLNSLSTGGAHPCHIGISSDGKKLAVSNYSGGNLTVFQLDATGSLLANKQLIDHKALDTTKTSHVHSATFSNNELFIADLGLDAVKRYKINENGLAPSEQSSIELTKGDGPRHLTFSSSSDFLYVINEHSSTIAVFKKDENGSYLRIASESTLAPSFEGDSYCADIHLSADGRFLYGSNRGENSIVVFDVNQNTGKLTYKESVGVEGDWPRNFTFDPSEKFLLVANQKSDNITVFSRDAVTGTLSFLHETSLSMPVCLEFL